MRLIISLLLLASIVLSDCPSGKVDITFRRVFKSYANEESFNIYAGAATTGLPVYSWDTVNTANTDITRTSCMDPGMYTLVLADASNNGWSAGAFLKITAGPGDLGIFRIESQQTLKAYEIFFPKVISYGSSWKYTNTAQTGNTWTNSAVSWTEASSFGTVSTLTRYFRKSYTLDSWQNYYNIEVNVKCRGGFVLYLNGIQAWTFNMPSGTISSTTAAVDSTTTDVIRTFSSLRGLYFTGGTIEIGIEVHSTSSTTSGAEWFNCEVVFNGGTVTRRVGTTYTATGPTGFDGEGVNMLFDGRADTKFCFTHTQGTEFFATIQFNNARREVVNNYRIASANDEPNRDPVGWTIRASNDGTEWVTLDVRSGITWPGGRMSYQTFKMQNYVAYNYYRYVGGYKVGSDGAYQFSEFDLYLENVSVATPGIAYPQTTYTFYTNEGNMDLIPIMGGYTNWQISPTTLPTGITFNSNTGAITGIATSTQTTTTYTVSATYLVDNKPYTCQLILSFESCSLPTRTFVTFTKDNAKTTTETYAVYKGTDKLYEYSGGAETESVSKRLCMSFETYTVKMISTVGAIWSDTSFLTITSDLQTPAITMARIRLVENEASTYIFSYQHPILPVAHNTNVKYRSDGTIDENWNLASFTPTDSWSSLTGTGTRPTTTSKITLYRVTFSLTEAQITAASGYELRYAALAGIVMYLNGHEVVRLNVGEGPVTSAMEALAGGSTVTTRVLTGKVGHLVNGPNILAVALIQLSTSGAAGTVFGDFMMRLMSDTQNYVRYWDHSSSGNVGPTVELFDTKSLTRYYQSKATKPEHVITVSFGMNRQEFFNKYCFVSNWDNQPCDPKEWVVSAADATEGPFTDVKTEDNVSFDDRSKSYCFYMPSVTRAYQVWRFTLKKSAQDTASYYGLGKINLLLENLDSITVPDLAFEPSEMTTYTGASFSGSIANSPYYSSFTISPSLPAGLTINSFNGGISGVATQELSRTTYTVTAKNHMGETKSAQVILTVMRCSDDKTSFSLEFITESGGKECGFELINKSSQQVVTKRDVLADYSRMYIPMCESATLYSIKLKKTDTSGWGSNRVIIRLADNTVLLMESLAGGESSKLYDFNVRYSVEPQFSTWRYYMDSAAPNDKWKSDASVTSSWKTGQPNSLPAATTITQYYVKPFDISSLAEFASMDLSFMVQAGGIMYINGHEVNRVNLPSSAITHTTPSTSSNDNALKYTVGFFVQESVLKTGENILAVELHRYSKNEEKNSFDASCILILDNMYMVMDGTGTSLPQIAGAEGTDKVFDNNSSTKMVRPSGCKGTELIWSYSGFRKEVISNYGLISASDCNERHPSGWELFGSNNNKDWLSLSIKTNQVFSAYKQQIRHPFFNVRAFNQYKLVITECDNKAIGSTTCSAGFQLADFYLFTKRLTDYCLAEGDYPPALEGDYSHANCEVFYTGSRKRLCKDKALGPEEVSCKVADPEGLRFTESPDGVLKLNVGVKVEIKPQVYAAEYSCQMLGKLPEGLSLDQKTCTLSGTPVNEQAKKEYNINLGNVAKTITVKMFIEIGPKPAPILLIIIIVVVVVLLIVGIVLWVMMSKKKQAAAPKKGAVKKAPAKKAGSTAPKAAAPAAKATAAVKV